MSIQDEIEDDLFVCEGVHVNMCRKYKNAKKENTGQSLWRKYKTGRGQGRRVCLKHLSLQFTPNPSNWVRTKFINFNLCHYIIHYITFSHHCVANCNDKILQDDSPTEIVACQIV